MTHHPYIDVLLEVWGTDLHYQKISHINLLELNEVPHWQQLLYHASLVLATDNVTVAAYISCLSQSTSSC